MFGKDIDKYLEESEWDIDSYEKMSHFSRGSGKNSVRDPNRLKAMEKAYLQRIETNTEANKSMKTKKTQNTSMTGPTGHTMKSKKPPAFREF